MIHWLITYAGVPDTLVLEAGSTGGEAPVLYIAVGDRAGRMLFEMARAYELQGGQ
jgi:hypothetical protein